MANTTVNKVVLGNETLLDLTADTVTPQTLYLGMTAHDASGAAIVGTMTGGGTEAGTVTQDENGFLVLDDDAGMGYQLDAASCTPSESQQVIRPGSGYYGLSQVTVGAVSSSYVGSGITRRSSSDLSASGATVTAPAGYYASSASKSVASGTAGTPTATKGTVSNHQVSVTPSVTNTTGYITGSTKTGTAVTVTASELASGNKEITSNGTGIDVVGYSTVSVNVGGSSNIQSLSITQNGTYTASGGVDGYSPITVNVSGGGSADLKAIIEGTAVTPTLPNDLTTIRDYAFYGLSSLALTSLPSSVTSIGVSAFYDCTNLALTSLPSGITNIDDYCFQKCMNLALTSLPSGVERIGSYAFYGCTNLALTALPDEYFAINTCAFYNCMNMPLASLGALFTSSIPSSAFYGCRAITALDCANATSIASNAFSGCNSLHTLVLRRTALCTLSNVSAFTNTPLRGYGGLTGAVYVPNDLISTYQTATNWSTLYNNGTVTFVKIEGSAYDLS